MQIKQIVLAVATALVAGQAAAVAVTPADIAAARALPVANALHLQETWLSGASAPTFNIFDGFALGCDVDTLRIFTANATAGKPGSIGNVSAYACKRAGVVSVMYHNVDGGSFNAYAPHLVGTAPDGTVMPKRLSRVGNLGTVSCTVAGTYTPATAVPYATGAIPVSAKCATVNPVATPDGATAQPAGGFSDVEAGLFGISVAAAGTEADANVTQAFGVVVTPNLYRELQVAQGIFTSVALANTGDATYDPAKAPNITSSQYASIAKAGGGYQADWTPLLGTAGAGKNVYLARRVATSGTQAASNAFFLKNPCATGAAGGSLPPAALADSTATFIVSEGSGTGNVKTTMTGINTAVAVGTAPAQNFGIGIVSTENNWRNETAANEGYRFVKVDGVHPEAGDTVFSRATSVNGQYNFVMEMKSFVANTADTFGAALIPAIAASLGAPANCADVPRGLMLNPLGGSICTVGTEVSKGTKFGNNCSPVQLFF
jgi:hypothetical protein